MRNIGKVKVSIIIPVYYNELYIGDFIEFLLDKTIKTYK